MQEHEWSWHLTYYLSQEATIQNQVCIETPFALFDVDYLIEVGGCKLGLMFGKLDETSQRAHSAFRDAMLIDAGVVDILYRFNGDEFSGHLQDCLALIAAWNPELFCRRGLINIGRLASEAVLSFTPHYSLSMFSLSSGLEAPLEFESMGKDSTYDEVMVAQNIVFRRMCRYHPEAWLLDYQRALVYYGVSPEQLNDRWATASCT